MEYTEVVETACGMFPSPCGVLVLKLYGYNKFIGGGAARFRPLAGFWFLNAINSVIENVAISLVSVPLRGSGS